MTQLQVLLHVMSNSCYFLHYPEMHYSEMGNSFVCCDIKATLKLFCLYLCETGSEKIPVAVWAVMGKLF